MMVAAAAVVEGELQREALEKESRGRVLQGLAGDQSTWGWH